MSNHGSAKSSIFLILLVTSFTVFITTGAALSEEDGLAYSLLKFSAGIVAGALIHEGSHAFVAGVTGTHLSWETGTYNQPIGFTENAGSDAKGVAVYSAGFVSQAAGAEVILRCDKIDKNDALVRGMMTWNIINPILYTLDYWIFRVSNKQNGRRYQGDLEGIEHYSNETTANAFGITFSAIALYQGYRFLKTQEWAPDWVKGETMERLNLTPLPSGGFILGYKVPF
jgi:hypothetical protein